MENGDRDFGASAQPSDGLENTVSEDGKKTVVVPQANELPDDTPDLSVRRFLQLLLDNRLFTLDEVSALESWFESDGLDQPAQEYAHQMVREGQLTDFQVASLLEQLKGGSAPLVYGDYVIVDKIASGGMGAVYRALFALTGEVMALKVVPQLDHRFEREVRASARLCHRHIVAVFDHGRVGENEYLAMEFVDGPNLADYVEKQGPLPVAKAVDYILQAARGISHIHTQRIVHRDIKPHNILVDSQGTVKLLDLGLARFDVLPSSFSGSGSTPNYLTTEGTILGTPAYTSPEQIEDSRTADGRADIYSLGCTLHFLLVGKEPYPYANAMKMITAHLSEPIPSLSARRSDAAVLEPIYLKMMAKKPGDRYASIDDVIADLESLNLIPGPSSPVVAAKPLAAAASASSAANKDKPAARSTGKEILILLLGLLIGSVIGLTVWATK